MSLLHKAWFTGGFYVLGWFFTILLFGTIAHFVIGAIFFGMESAPRCNEYICYREY